MLANWMFTWDANAWGNVVVQPPPPPVAQDPGAGGGKKKNEYVGPDPEFWEVRERYLRRFLPAEAAPVPTPVPKREEREKREPRNVVSLEQARLARLEAMRRDTALQAQQAATRDELQSLLARHQQLLFDIAQARQQNRDRAAIILLLDLI